MRTEKFITLKFILSLIILFNLSTGCHQSFESSVEKKIIEDSKTHYKVLISLKAVTNFEWDLVYIFEPEASKEEINKVLGFEYPYYRKSRRIYVFIKNEKIVHHEEGSVFTFGRKSRISFYNGDSLNYRCFRSEESFFMVEQKKVGKSDLYEMIHLK